MAEFLVCPIDLEPLENAVTLIPCMHRLNEEPARTLYTRTTQVSEKIFKIIPRGLGWEQSKCPLCRTVVSEIVIDPTIRQIIHSILMLSPFDSLLTASEVEKLRSLSKEQTTKLISEKSLKTEIPLSTLELETGGTKTSFPCVQFVATNRFAPIQRYTIGWSGGKLTTTIDFRISNLKPFLLKHELDASDDHFQGNLWHTHQTDESKKAFAFIAKFTQMKPSYLLLLQKIFSSKNEEEMPKYFNDIEEIDGSSSPSSASEPGPWHHSFSNLMSQLFCPLDLEPFTGAVELFPCMHRINEKIARQHFNLPKDLPTSALNLKDSPPCPVCKIQVTSLAIDRSIREITKTIFDVSPIDAYILSSSIEMLAGLTNRKEREAFMEQKTTDFEVTPLDIAKEELQWDYPAIELQASGKFYPIQSYILAWKDEKLHVVIHFRPNSKINELFARYQLKLDEDSWSWHTSTFEEVKRSFALLVRYSSLKLSVFQALRKIIDSKNEEDRKKSFESLKKGGTL